MANNEYHNPEHPAPTSPYGSGDPYYTKSSGYMASGTGAAKSSKKNWLKFGVPIAILVIVGAVVGGVLGSRSKKSNSSNSSGDNNGNGGSNGGTKGGLGRFPTSTDSFYGMPIYPSSVSLFSSSSSAEISWCLYSFFIYPPIPHWTTDLLPFLPFPATRPTLPSMPNRHSLPIPTRLGPAIPSAPGPHHPRPYAQTDLG